mmetsp:Transcript_26230/g.38778  ORF Transcript_26230/g.38778 Transcript_26230/m.38778 type:complete len:256 (+) Transcript_26230:160-927(+)|eukprot:CAMPEP_0194256050 /NCGR_PEP_ID=MMETSP0158-20130606/35886_1 /TAXON_ID=33649 /ORGANISM="Thalassionema nitzschioides, Strain L26-B" /LENGTH=255 /DNA_ID=CAMNT_0038994607 /DNA_START=17 /DNA_END=784 /DNA_ORIENTATION=+
MICDQHSLVPVVSGSDIQSVFASRKRGRSLCSGGKTAGEETADKKPRIISVPDALSSSLSKRVPQHEKENTNSNDSWLPLSDPTALLKSFKLPGMDEEKRKCTKPNERDIAAYNKTVVTAVRTSDLKSLKAMHLDGQSLDACNPFGESLIHMACRRGDPSIVKYLVEDAKVKTDVTDDFGRTCLHDAAWTPEPNFDVVRILIKAIEPRMLLAEDVRGHAPFDYARKEHRSAWVRFFMEHKGGLEVNPSSPKSISV